MQKTEEVEFLKRDEGGELDSPGRKEREKRGKRKGERLRKDKARNES